MPAIKKNISFDEKVAAEIINQAKVCFLALSENGKPYNVPMNFGYEPGYFYLHTGPGGKKLEVIKQNKYASIAISIDEKLHFRNENMACSYSMLYKSVVADGEIEFIEENEEKARILNIIMKQYTRKDNYVYGQPSLDNVIVFKLKINQISSITRIFG